MYQLDPLDTFEIVLIAVVVISGVSFIPAIIGAVVGVLLARITPGVGPLMGGFVGAVGGPLVVLVSLLGPGITSGGYSRLEDAVLYLITVSWMMGLALRFIGHQRMARGRAAP